MIHILKTDSEFFRASWHGDKPFEIRDNDRNFKVEDLLYLFETQYSGTEMKEGKPLVYTGGLLVVKVRYILKGPFHKLAENGVVMTVDKMHMYQPKEN